LDIACDWTQDEVRTFMARNIDQFLNNEHASNNMLHEYFGKMKRVLNGMQFNLKIVSHISENGEIELLVMMGNMGVNRRDSVMCWTSRIAYI